MRRLDSKKAVWSKEAINKLKQDRNTPEYIAGISGANSPTWQGGISQTGCTSYKNFNSRIPANIPIRRDPNNYYVLQTVCMHCGKWFSPRKRNVDRKINGERDWKFFCSIRCTWDYRHEHTPTQHTVVVKTILYKQLLHKRKEIKKLNRQLDRAKIIAKNEAKLLRQKEYSRKKRASKALLLKGFRIVHPNRYKKYKNSTTSLWFETKRWQDPSNWRINRIITLARRRAKEKGWKIDLDKKWCRERIDRCEATNILFDNTYEGTFITMNPYAPSIDRIDNNRGYTRDNCRLVLTAFNSLKSTLSDEELYKNLKQFVEYHENNTI